MSTLKSEEDSEVTDDMAKRLARMQGMMGNEYPIEGQENEGNVQPEAEAEAPVPTQVQEAPVPTVNKGPVTTPRKLTQGDSYEENKNAPVEENKKVKTRKEKKPMGLPIKPIAIGTAAMLVAGIGIFGVWKAGLLDNKEEPKGIEELLDAQNMGEELEIETQEFSYTDDELSRLRERGYTSSEIEEAIKLETDAKELIDRADKEREEYLNKTMKPLFDTASPTYKKNASTTWLGLKDNSKNIKKMKKNVPYTEYEAIKNFDYEKIPIRGYQPFVKIYIDGTKHKDWIFMMVTPQRYNELKSRGNIIVRFTYIVETKIDKEGNIKENKKNYYITKIEEYESGETERDTFDEINKSEESEEGGYNPPDEGEIEIEGLE